MAGEYIRHIKRFPVTGILIIFLSLSCSSTKRNLSRVVPWTTICSWLQNFNHKYFSIVDPSRILSENKKIYLVFNNASPCLESTTGFTHLVLVTFYILDFCSHLSFVSSPQCSFRRLFATKFPTTLSSSTDGVSLRIRAVEDSPTALLGSSSPLHSLASLLFL